MGPIHNKPDDGGPAFPLSQALSQNAFPGMSLRDYFAAQAMVGILSSQNNWMDAPYDEARVALSAYCLADAMIVERVADE